MYISVDYNIFGNEFSNYGRDGQFSEWALGALFEYLEHENIELDVIDLCCTYAESSAEEIASEYFEEEVFDQFLEPMRQEREDEITEELTEDFESERDALVEAKMQELGNDDEDAAAQAVYEEFKQKLEDEISEIHFTIEDIDPDDLFEFLEDKLSYHTTVVASDSSDGSFLYVKW
jgi:hypothetical protein